MAIVMYRIDDNSLYLLPPSMTAPLPWIVTVCCRAGRSAVSVMVHPAGRSIVPPVRSALLSAGSLQAIAVAVAVAFGAASADVAASVEDTAAKMAHKPSSTPHSFDPRIASPLMNIAYKHTIRDLAAILYDGCRAADHL